MKKPILLILSLSAGILTASTLLGFRGSKKISALNFKGKKVLFIGDSHTALYNAGWQSVLAKRYGFYEKNTAIGGKTTDWMLNQLNLSLSSGEKFYACFIYGGANDAYNTSISNEKAVSNIQKMVDICNKNNVIPIVIVGYNTRKVSVGNPAMPTTSYVKTKQGMWDLAERRYQQQLLMQRSIKNAIVIPMWDNVNYSTAPIDGLHLNVQSQTDFANYIDSKLFSK